MKSIKHVMWEHFWWISGCHASWKVGYAWWNTCHENSAQSEKFGKLSQSQPSCFCEILLIKLILLPFQLGRTKRTSPISTEWFGIWNDTESTSASAASIWHLTVSTRWSEKIEAGSGECGGVIFVKTWVIYASIWRLQFLNAIFFRYGGCKYAVT